MVKRFSCIFIVLVFVFLFTIPSFAFDVVQSDSNLFGFSYDNNAVVYGNPNIDGFNLSVDNQYISCQKIYFYIPVTRLPETLDFYFTLATLYGSVNLTSCDWGYVYGYDYHIESSMPLPSLARVGSSTVYGSSVRFLSMKMSFSDFGTMSSDYGSRYIRAGLTVDSSYSELRLCTYLNKDLTQNLSGVLGNPTYSLSATQGDHVGTVSSGSLTESGYYITGSLKNKYYNGSSVATNTGTLTSGTTGSGGYLWVPSHTISATASSPLKMNISGGNISGSLSPSSVSSNTDLQGTYLDRTFIDTVSLNATRSYNDEDLIDTVNDASDRNHDDLGRIEDQMQEVVDHMQGLEAQGNEINGTTSQSTINNATGVVNTGTSSMSDTANYVSSGVTSGSAESQGYVQLLGYGVGEIVNFGSSSTPLGVWIWAIIFIPVAFFIFRRISE